jgi:hypothetical protein
VQMIRIRAESGRHWHRPPAMQNGGIVRSDLGDREVS